MPLPPHLPRTDIYLLDQILRGRIVPGMAVLDAACGGGRNLPALIDAGCEVHGVDRAPEMVEAARASVVGHDPGAPQRIHVASVEKMPFPDAQFDAVVCNALLHFAEGEEHFLAMLREMARVLKPGGLFFARLMSTHGVEPLIRDRGGRLFDLPSGQTVVLVDEPWLRALTSEIFEGQLSDPIKSTIVHGQRTMTTWVLRRG